MDESVGVFDMVGVSVAVLDAERVSVADFDAERVSVAEAEKDMDADRDLETVILEVED